MWGILMKMKRILGLGFDICGDLLSWAWILGFFGHVHGCFPDDQEVFAFTRPSGFFSNITSLNQ